MDEVLVDHASLAQAARRVQEAADLLGEHANTLKEAISGGVRSPWGIGVIGMAMDQINQMLSQACDRVQTNLGETSAAVAVMADRAATIEHANTTTIQALDLSTPSRPI
ncbi:hypothetical protein [Nonomuraea cavernae]|uniref:Uncharacterized protein n=1 Tax=Nonomuraea cavernae TaxID=2045107 RepID=A0A917ZF62_9ACTN|nr:hypothetical protein [Nonomuraea cavernae]MCA2189527.1 hypothetical protein [Nonomuraea cavernae]GGO81713.1 hypothetical protein GCM10012289_71320 [Nonomuraea cavernae]